MKYLVWIIVGILPLLIIIGTAKQLVFDTDFYQEQFQKHHNKVDNRATVLQDVLDYLDNDKDALRRYYC